MAMEDIEAMRAAGVDVTPRDVVRLNALGLKVERSSRSADFHMLPRVAWAGEAVFREPTVAHEAWMCVAEKLFDLDDEDTVVLLRALCLSSKVEDLPDPSSRADVMDAIERLKAGPIASCTVRQLVNALGYALMGANACTGEHGPARVSDRTDADTDPDDFTVGRIIQEGVVMGLGTVRELSAMTESQVEALVLYKREVEYGEHARKGAHGRSVGAYLVAKDDIMERAASQDATAHQDEADEHDDQADDADHGLDRAERSPARSNLSEA